MNAISVLNVAAGKIFPLELPEDYFLVNIDTSYYDSVTPSFVESEYYSWNSSGRNGRRVFFLRENCFDYMSRTSIEFDRLAVYRFLEHVKWTDVLFFIYLLSKTVRVGGEVDVIVPDYQELALRLLQEDVTSQDFEKENILLTTELLNEPSCPHASIWTKRRARYYFELEGRFIVEKFYQRFLFDGRNIYIRFIARRIQ